MRGEPCAYWLLFLPFVMRRDAGAVGLADLLVLVLVADAFAKRDGG